MVLVGWVEFGSFDRSRLLDWVDWVWKVVFDRLVLVGQV